mgnify:FL=1
MEVWLKCQISSLVKYRQHFPHYVIVWPDVRGWNLGFMVILWVCLRCKSSMCCAAMSLIVLGYNIWVLIVV